MDEESVGRGWSMRVDPEQECRDGEGKEVQEIVSQTVGWQRGFRKLNSWGKELVKARPDLDSL